MCPVGLYAGGRVGIEVEGHVDAEVAVAFSLAGAHGGPIDGGGDTESFTEPLTTWIVDGVAHDY